MSKKIKVNSSNLEFVEYIADKKELRIWFLNEKNVIYAYADVTQQIYEDLIKSSSVGGYFESYIKYKYKFEKLGTPEDKKTLSDKIFDQYGFENDLLKTVDVKEAIKKFIEVMNDGRALSITGSKERME